MTKKGFPPFFKNKHLMKQLDVDVSPLANIMTLRLTHMTLDLEH